MEKLPALEKNFRIHLIGRLQSNKVKYIIDHVCLIHSVDRLSLAQEIDRQAQKHNRVMPVLIQVSPCGEAQKGGFAAAGAFRAGADGGDAQHAGHGAAGQAVR